MELAGLIKEMSLLEPEEDLVRKLEKLTLGARVEYSFCSYHTPSLQKWLHSTEYSILVGRRSGDS